MSVDYRVGDVRERMAEIPDGSISLVASSPPFLALRSYLPAGHSSKGDEIGSEANPAAFLDTLLALTAEWGRVLAPWGSIAIELGDTFSGSGGAGGDYNPDGLREGQPTWTPQRARTAASTSASDSDSDAATDAATDWLTSSQPRTPEESRRGTDAKNRGKTSRGTGAGGAWPGAKSLALIPQLYAASLAYGFNVLRRPMSAEEVLWWIDNLRSGGMSAEAALAMVGGWVATHPVESPAGRWLVRNVLVWHRPNPAVGALGDKFRPSTSYITVATRSPKRWFDLDAVRTAVQHPGQKATGRGGTRLAKGGDDTVSGQGLGDYDGSMSAGAPPLDAWFDEHDTWTITTQPSKLAHYAMWPPKLAERLILSMCPAEVCSVCGEPRRRVTRATYAKTQATSNPSARGVLVGVNAPGSDQTFVHGRADKHVETLGWSDCCCGPDCVPATYADVHYPAEYTPDGGPLTYAKTIREVLDPGHCDGTHYVAGTVLDPFAGTGTTLAVAHLHGRDAIGIDIDARNADLYPRRLEECKRALFGTLPELPGQTSLFGEAAV